MREVKTQPVVGYELARLLHMGAKHLPQRGLQKVRRRMVALDCRAAVRIDLKRQRIADRYRAAVDYRAVQEIAGMVLFRVPYSQSGLRVLRLAAVARLSAAFRVERRFVEHQYDLFSRVRRAYALALMNDCEQLCLRGVVRVAGELCRR